MSETVRYLPSHLHAAVNMRLKKLEREQVDEVVTLLEAAWDDGYRQGITRGLIASERPGG